MKQVKFILFLSFVICYSCQMDNTLSKEEARQAILGKWVLVSTGEREDNLTMVDCVYDGMCGSYIEYLPEGIREDFHATGHIQGIDSSLPPPYGIGGIIYQYHYSIDDNYLKLMLNEGEIDVVTDCYKFTFYDKNKKLRITRQHELTDDRLYWHVYKPTILLYERY